MSGVSVPSLGDLGPWRSGGFLAGPPRGRPPTLVAALLSVLPSVPSPHRAPTAGRRRRPGWGARSRAASVGARERAVSSVASSGPSVRRWHASLLCWCPGGPPTHPVSFASLRAVRIWLQGDFLKFSIGFVSKCSFLF